ncbi:NHL repeat-containing protein [Halosimplex salinum]|uniref:NHL repeat-containing protein n=1 Tax=Halosimplex salinum TaxID=1710538 RepID=UPI0019D0405A|nr:NHL repeat-containing protein [Halosimplex salinum]
MRSTAESPAFPAPLADCDLRLASPVGVTQDCRGNVWVADAGNSRLVVVDDALQRVLGQIGGAGDASGSFDLPLRLTHHPTEAAVFVADTANGRVQRLDYEYDGPAPLVTGNRVFASGDDFHPNGVVAHEYWDGVRVVVADEFYREGDDLRGRLVVFDAEGTELRSIRAIGEDDSHGLYWPQGIDVDDEGRLYVANTGHGVLNDGPAGPSKLATVVRCDRHGDPVPFAGRSDAVLAELPMPRDVAVVGSGRAAQIFVPDAATGRVHVYTSVGIEDAVVPENHEDLRARAALEEGVGLPHDGDERSQRRFRGPVGIRPFEGHSLPDSDADDPTLAVLVSEGLAQRVGAYAVDIHWETARRFDAIGGAGGDPGRFSVPTGSTLDEGDGPLAGRAFVADGANGRLQQVDLGATAGDDAGGRDGGAVAPVDLPATRFPFGLAYWRAGAGGDRLFVTDYTARYREDDDSDQIHVYAVDDASDAEGGCVDLSLVHSFGTWGLGDGEVKLPRGVAVEPVGATRARVFVADSGNGRVGVWEYDWVSDEAESLGDRGGFGHFEGGFWNPSDVAVGDRGVYVADENNNRLQRFDGEDWHAVGSPGYGSGHEFLLPIAVDAHDGHLFVLDLVTRAIEVFAEDAAAPGGLRPVDSIRAFGGEAGTGDLWLPYLLSAGDASDAPGTDIVVPDSTLHVAQHYTWDGG